MLPTRIVNASKKVLILYMVHVSSFRNHNIHGLWSVWMESWPLWIMCPKFFTASTILPQFLFQRSVPLRNIRSTDITSNQSFAVRSLVVSRSGCCISTYVLHSNKEAIPVIAAEVWWPSSGWYKSESELCLKHDIACARKGSWTYAYMGDTHVNTLKPSFHMDELFGIYRTYFWLVWFWEWFPVIAVSWS